MAPNGFTRWIEGKGMGLRKLISRSPYVVLDPFDLATKMNVLVVSPYDIDLPQDVMNQLLSVDSKSWSAGCIKLTEDRALILFNPTHADSRINATIMEELAHIYLGHKTSKISNTKGDLCRRSYRKSDETQAYAVGSAALIPSALLQRARSDGTSRASLAKLHNVSEKLVSYRENTTGIKLI